MSDLNFRLHPAQLEIFKDDHRFKVVAAGRRFGKSFLSIINLLIEGLKDVNGAGFSLSDKQVWYVSPTFQQGKDIVWAKIKELGASVIESTVENTGTIKLINGRVIQIKGSDRPDTLRGPGLSYVVLDEYAFMKPDVWDEIIFPTLTEVKGEAMFIGTPAGKNHFYEIYMDAINDDSGEWKAWHFNSVDNPILDPEDIKRAQNKLSNHSFRQEFQASFETVGGGLFKEEWIIYDEDEPTEGQYYITVDPAGYGETKDLTKGNLRRLDETAISIVKVHSGGWWIKEIDAGRWGVRETALRILKHSRSVHSAAVGIERGSLKNAIMPYLEDYMRQLGYYPRIEDLTHGGKKKSERITWALQGRFERGRIKLNKGEWTNKFTTQLFDFPNPMTHDDLLDSLAYMDQLAVTNYDVFGLAEEWEPIDPDAGY